LAPAKSDPLMNALPPEKARLVKTATSHFARLLLTATFLEDGYRIIVDFNQQMKFLTLSRGMWSWLAFTVLVVSVVVQFGGSGALIAKQYLSFAVVGLSSVLILQTLCYGYLFDFNFFMRNVSVIGALIVCLANERQKEVRSNPFNGAFTLGGGQRLTYMQLASRVLVALLFFSLLGKHWTWMRIVGAIIVAVPVTAVVVGYKARTSSALLAIFLLVSNVVMNGYWWLPNHHPERDFKKYYFFQTLTVTGGMLVLTEMGAGGLSIDERNKDL